MSMQRPAITCLVAAAMLTGCVLGPDYHQPENDLSAEFVQQESLPSAETVRSDWWASFNDPMLVSLVETGLQHNHDLRIAVQNVNIARAQLGDTRWERLPGTSLDADVRRTKTSQEVSSASQPRENRYSGILNVSWELDIFGRIQRLVEAQEARAEATAEDLRSVQVMVAADIVSQYLQLRAAQRKLAVAQKNEVLQQDVLVSIDALVEAGANTALDLELAKSQLWNIRSDMPAFEADIQIAIHRLSVLTGKLPNALTDQLSPVQPMPSAPQTIAVSTPYALLQRRPDVRASERQLAAATADIGVAVANLYPRFDLSSLWGVAARELSALNSSTAQTWNIGLGVSWPAFNLPRAKLAVEITESQAELMQINYQKTVLTALEEVETSLIRFLKTRERRSQSEQAWQASKRASELAQIRFDAGASDFLSTLEIEQRRLEAENRYIQSEIELSQAVVTVFRVLAGGWEVNS